MSSSSSSSSSSSTIPATTNNTTTNTTSHTTPPPPLPSHSYKVEDNEYTQGGFENRILLALKSNLPNEIDWALAKLCSISYTNDRFHLQSIPGLLDTLIHICLTFAEQCQSDLNDLLLSKDQLIHQTRCNLILHALRNFSFVQTNFRYLTSARGFLFQLLTLPDLGKTLELKLMALDILENVAFMLKLEPKPMDMALLSHLHTLALHSDRALVLGSLRTLCRLALLEANEPIFTLHLQLTWVQQLCQWLSLLHVDEELVHRVLDYLYQFTLLSPTLTNLIASALTSTHLKLILLCVKYKCPSSKAFDLNDPKPFMQTRLQHWLQKPVTPLTLDMQKTYSWILNYVEPDPRAWLPKTVLKLQLETHPYPCPIRFTTFLEWIPQVCPVHVMEDHVIGLRIKSYPQHHTNPINTHSNSSANSSSATPMSSSSSSHLRLSNSSFYETKTTLIPPSPHTPSLLKPNQEEKEWSCSWNDCHSSFSSVSMLKDHVLRFHVPKSKFCLWGRNTCGWPISERHILTSHFHQSFTTTSSASSSNLSSSSSTSSSSTTSSNSSSSTSSSSNDNIPVYHHIHIETTTDPMGVPYTASLVLRNLAKASNATSLFAPIYDDLVLASSMYPRLTKYLMCPLNELQITSQF